MTNNHEAVNLTIEQVLAYPDIDYGDEIFNDLSSPSGLRINSIEAFNEHIITIQQYGLSAAAILQTAAYVVDGLFDGGLDESLVQSQHALCNAIDAKLARLNGVNNINLISLAAMIMFNARLKSYNETHGPLLDLGFSSSEAAVIIDEIGDSISPKEMSSAYIGQYESTESYAEQIVYDLFDGLSDHPVSVYIDYAAFFDCELRHDVLTVDLPNGSVAIFQHI